MPEIQLEETDRLDWALKAFKKKMQKSGIFATLRRKRYYTKPSEARGLVSTGEMPPRGPHCRKAPGATRHVERPGEG